MRGERRVVSSSCRETVANRSASRRQSLTSRTLSPPERRHIIPPHVCLDRRCNTNDRNSWGCVCAHVRDLLRPQHRRLGRRGRLAPGTRPSARSSGRPHRPLRLPDQLVGHGLVLSISRRRNRFPRARTSFTPTPAAVPAQSRPRVTPENLSAPSNRGTIANRCQSSRSS
jgi:hypothetical protein